MVSDEEILERAFLSALQKYFKKPGPWLPIETFVAGAPWKPERGQLWEVYVDVPGSQNLILNGIVMAVANTILGESWYPASCYSIDLSGEIGTPGGGDTVLNGIRSYSCMEPSGWILGENDTISCVAAYKIRRRRRFDLET